MNKLKPRQKHPEVDKEPAGHYDIPACPQPIKLNFGDNPIIGVKRKRDEESKATEWTSKEVLKLLLAFHKHGCKSWDKIKQYFPNKEEKEIKSKFKSEIKKIILENKTMSLMPGDILKYISIAINKRKHKIKEEENHEHKSHAVYVNLCLMCKDNLKQYLKEEAMLYCFIGKRPEDRIKKEFSNFNTKVEQMKDIIKEFRAIQG